MIALPEHPARVPLIDELHARPFAPLEGPARVVHLAFLPEEGDAPFSHDAKVEHLMALLKHLGASPDDRPDRNFHVARIGELQVRWERHTEFVSLALTELAPDHSAGLFEPTPLSLLPSGWIEAAPGKVICATLSEVLPSPSREASAKRLDQELGGYFDRDSWAVAYVGSGLAMATSDFRRDPNGFVRMAIMAEHNLGPRRLGRISQRLIELETYRALAMLALPVARSLGPRLTEIDQALERMARDATSRRAVDAAGAPADRDDEQDGDRAMLDELTRIAAELESLAAGTAFRFGAARAYAAIVDERLTVLREERARDRQIFGEFMLRRFKPAMRTCWSTMDRLSALSARAERAANLLRTRVDVSLEAQNKKLLESMNRRAQVQLRLQQTVEGLSVVAISYYAVSLAGYLLAPLAKLGGVSETMAKGLVALPIVAGVYFLVRRVRRRIEKRAAAGGDDVETGSES